MNTGKWHQKEFVKTQISRKYQYFKYASDELKNDKVFVMDALTKKGELLEFVSENLKNDIDVVKKAMDMSSDTLKFASAELKNNKAFIKQALEKRGSLLQYASNELKKDIEVVMLAVKQDGEALGYASNLLRDNKEIVKTAVRQYGPALYYASDILKDDKDIVMTALYNEGRSIQYASERLRKEKNMVLYAIKNHHKEGTYDNPLRYISTELKNDRDVVMAAVKNNGGSFQYAGDKLRNDKEVILCAITNFKGVYSDHPLKYTSEELKNDKDVITAAIQKKGWLLEYASESLKKDLDICLIAVKENLGALEYVDKSIRNKKEFVIEQLKRGQLNFENIRKELKNDREVILLTVSNYKGNSRDHPLNHVSDDIKNDKEIVMAAVKQNGSYLNYASDSLKNDIEVALCAINNYSGSVYDHPLQYTSALRNNKDIVMAALHNDGRSLQYASETLKNNREIVITAVKKIGQALSFASDSLKDDKDIVMAALHNDGRSIQYASEKLRNDRDIVMTAVKNNGESFKYAADTLRNDKEVILFAIDKCSGATYNHPIKYAGDVLKSDKEVVMAAIKQDSLLLEYASEELKNDQDIILESVKNNIPALQYAGSTIRSDLDFMKKMMMKNLQARRYMIITENQPQKIIDFLGQDLTNTLKQEIKDQTIWKNTSFFDVRFIVEIYHEIPINFVDQDFLSLDNPYLLYVLKNTSKNPKNTSGAVKTLFERAISTKNTDIFSVLIEKELVKKAHVVEMMEQIVESNTPYIISLAVAYTEDLNINYDEASEKDRNNVLKLLQKPTQLSGILKQKIIKKYSNDYQIAIEALKKDGSIYKHLSEQLREDKDIALEAVKQYPSYVENLIDTLKDDREIIIQAITHFEGYSYANPVQYSSNRLKADKDIALLIVKHDVYAFKFVDQIFKKSKDFVMEAANVNGHVIAEVDDIFRNDRDVVLAAVRQNGESLRYVSERLKDDEEVVRSAVMQNGISFEHASENLRNNKDIALMAINSNGHAYEYIGNELKNDEELIQVAAKKIASIETMSTKLKNHRQLCLLMVLKDPVNYNQLVKKFKDDEELLVAKQGQLIYDIRYGNFDENAMWPRMIDLIAQKYDAAVEVKFPDKRVNTYNSKGYLCVGDKVIVEGKITDIGTVTKVHNQAKRVPYMQYVKEIVSSLEGSYIGTCDVKKQMEADQFVMLKLIKGNFIYDFDELMKILIKFKNYWIAATLNKDYQDIFRDDILYKYGDDLFELYSDDEDFMKSVMKLEPWMICFASNTIKKNIDIVIKSLCNCEFADYKDTFSEINEFHSENRILSIVSVSIDGLALEFTDKKFKKDKEIVLRAVQNNGLALQFANDELKNDLDVVLAAVKGNGTAIAFASDNLKKNPVIISEKGNDKGEKDFDIQEIKRIGDFEVRFEDQQEAVITKYFGKKQLLEIPNYIEGYRIYDMDIHAFKDNQWIEKVILPNELNYIGKEVFLNCSNLKEVIFPDALHSIDQSAFEGCSLETVVLPNRIGFIKARVFANNQSLSYIKLPKYVAYIDEHAFQNCPDIKIDVEQSEIYKVNELAFDVPYIDLVEASQDCASSKSNKQEQIYDQKLTFAATGKFEQFTRESLKEYIENKGHHLLDKISNKANYLINNDITSTSGKNKFAKENNIKIISETDLLQLLDVTISDVLIPIDQQSDAIQQQVTSLDKQSVPEIHQESHNNYMDDFLKESGINQIDIAQIIEKSKKALLMTEDGLTVRKIRKDNKNNIIVIPEGVETIAKEAFKDNEVVEYVLLPQSLETIENYAFSKCTKLSYVGIPNVELSFGSNAFNGCKSLKKIDLPDDAILGESTFEQTGLESITCKSKYNRIPRRCFSEIESLKEVVIEKNIKDIASRAFSGCSQLKNIHVSKNVEKMGEDVFDACLDLKITTEHPSKPDGWNEHWNPMFCPTAWDYLENSGKDPIYKQEGKTPKIIYTVAIHFGGANVQIFNTTDSVEPKDRVCIKGTSKCGNVVIKKLVSAQRYTRENQEIVELKKV